MPGVPVMLPTTYARPGDETAARRALWLSVMSHAILAAHNDSHAVPRRSPDARTRRKE